MWTVVRNLAIALTHLVAATSPSFAEGVDKIYENKEPNPLWNEAVGSLFDSGKSYAVVIGISNYIGTGQGGYPRLSAVSQDAFKMKDFLLRDAGFDVVYLVTEERVTKNRIEELMTDAIPNQVGPNDRFLFYWSGHGDQRIRTSDGVAFGFLPLANSKMGIFASMISMDDIARWNSYLAARQALFVLDACLSGLAGVQSKSANVKVRLDQLAQPSRQLVTAGTSTEEVIAGSRWNGSLFTDAFISGAKGNAAPPGEIISIYRLIDYIQDRVAIERTAAHWKKGLTPQLQDLSGSDGAFFFLSPAAGNALSRPEITSLQKDGWNVSEKGAAGTGFDQSFGPQPGTGSYDSQQAISIGLLSKPTSVTVPSKMKYHSPNDSKALGSVGGAIWVDFYVGNRWFRLSDSGEYVKLDYNEMSIVANASREPVMFPFKIKVQSTRVFPSASLTSAPVGSVGGLVSVDAYAGYNFYRLANGEGYIRLEPIH